jgi:hypothetical protein
MGKLFSAEQIVIVSVSGNRETKSWVVLLSVSTRSPILSFIFILFTCLGDVSGGGSCGVPLFVLLPAPQAT